MVCVCVIRDADKSSVISSRRCAKTTDMKIKFRTRSRVCDRIYLYYEDAIVMKKVIYIYIYDVYGVKILSIK